MITLTSGHVAYFYTDNTGDKIIFLEEVKPEDFGKLIRSTWAKHQYYIREIKDFNYATEEQFKRVFNIK